MKVNQVIIAIILAIAASSSALTCYYLDNGSITTITAPAGGYICTSYGYTCIVGDSSCTDQEQIDAANKTMYTFTTQANCNNLAGNPSKFTNVVCCNTDLCNAPSDIPMAAPVSATPVSDTPVSAAPVSDVPNGAAPMAATPVAAPTGATAPKSATPIRISFGHAVVPSAVLVASVIALIC